MTNTNYSEKETRITCVCIDDEPFALATVEEYCSRVPWLKVIGAFTDALSAVACIENEQPQVLFLDIQMPDIGGLQIARNVDYEPAVVFTTAYSQYAVEGFELEAVDYLLKPYSFDRFLTSAEKVRKRLGIAEPDLRKTIQLKSGYKTLAIAIDDIIYIEALDSYSTIVTPAGKTVVHHQLKQVSDLLPSEMFMRVHRSFIVHRRFISSFTKSQINLQEHTIPVGRSYAKDFVAFMQQ